MPVLSDHEFTIFSAARKLALAERPAFLEKACAGNLALRQCIEELLQINEQATAFMESAAGGIAPRPGRPVRAANRC